MNISVEMSMYPLAENYGTPILRFIERLKTHDGLTIHTNTMSTQIYGSYDLVMDVLKEEMKAAFEGENAVVMVVKLVNIDLRP